LEDGKKYQWHVKAQQDDMLYTSKDISFTILSSQQKKELQMMVNGLKGLLGQSENNPSNRSLIGAIFEESGLYLDAEREYKAAIKLNPKEPKFHVLLGDLYFKLELYELAEREFKTFFKP
jgi:tetratricopeptide (TPR) repeat protein